MNFTLERIRLLAQAERDMDSGKIPYTMLDGRRVAIEADAMEALNLQQGQTINWSIFIALQEWRIAQCRHKLAEEAVEKAAQEEVVIGPDFLNSVS